jgi:hypothetical protein
MMTASSATATELSHGDANGYIVNGDYESESNLQMSVEGRCEGGGTALRCCNDKDVLSECQKALLCMEYKCHACKLLWSWA